MEYSDFLKKNVREQIRARIKNEKRADKEIDKFCDKYRNWYKEEKALGRKPITVLAEGDSWFLYIVGKAVVYHLERELKTDILNLAFPGDEVREMLSPKQKKRLIRELKKGPSPRNKFDYLLFSGGGNDLVGIDRFYKWLHPYEKRMKPKDILNKKTLKAALSLVENCYNEVVSIRDTCSPKTHLLFHSYDYAIPDGRGVCGKGPWLKPGLDHRKVPERYRRNVVKLFLGEFDKTLKRVARNSEKITVVKTQGTLNDGEWANELHPKNIGFKKIAKLFKNEIAQS